MVTKKSGFRKVPPNVPAVTLDGVSFHSEDSVHKWKYVLQRRMTDEWNISTKYQSYTLVIELIKTVGLMKTVKNVGPFYPRLI